MNESVAISALQTDLRFPHKSTLKKSRVVLVWCREVKIKKIFGANSEALKGWEKQRELPSSAAE